MSDHAKYSPSGSKKWIPCPGSMSLEEGVPNKSSPEAAEGTAAHELASKCLEMSRPALDFLGSTIVADGQKFVVDHEMVDNVQQYIDFVHGVEGQHHWVETRVYYTNWVKKGHGRADDIKINVFRAPGVEGESHKINVIDLKYGKGVEEFADMNSQAMIYALGVLQTFGLYFDFKDTDIVNCVIFQPRIKEVPSQFEITVGELLKWADDVMVPAVADAESENPTFKSGDKQCRFCRAKPFCPTLAAESMKTASGDFHDFTKPYNLRDRKKLTNAEIGIIMGQIPALKTWTNSIEAYAYDQLNDGVGVPGYKLVEGKRGDKKWTDDNEVVLKTLEEFDIKKEEVISEKIKTPTMVEKILKVKKFKETEIKHLWKQAKGKPTIAKASDDRKEIESQQEAAFKAVTNQT